MNHFAAKHQQVILLRSSNVHRAMRFGLGLLMSLMCSSTILAQGNQQLPAFEDPSFKDKLWEAGGPQFSNAGTGKLILSVTIEGEQSVSEHKILSHMQSRVDRVFDPETLNRDLSALYGTELFSRIKPSYTETAEGVHLKLVVQEKPIVSRVIYHGNVKLDDRILKKHAGIEPGDPISGASVEQAKNRLVDLYRDKGFGNADVQVAKGNRPGDRDVIFRISEGELERVAKVEFIGNYAFSTDLLKTKIKTKDARKGLTSYIGNVADRSKIDEDQDRLYQYYRRLGYFDAKLQHSIKYDESGKWLTITFVISEGAQFFVNEIAVSGNKYFTNEELMSLATLKDGVAFNQDKMERDARSIRELYGAKGFIFVEVTPTPVYLPDNKINLIYEIEEGEVYVAEDVRVHIAGDSTYTKERVILNQAGTNVRPGELIDARELVAMERRLSYSQIVEVDPSKGEPPRVEVQRPEEDLQMAASNKKKTKKY